MESYNLVWKVAKFNSGEMGKQILFLYRGKANCTLLMKFSYTLEEKHRGDGDAETASQEEDEEEEEEDSKPTTEVSIYMQGFALEGRGT